jgi:hypothetical protein
MSIISIIQDESAIGTLYTMNNARASRRAMMKRGLTLTAVLLVQLTWTGSALAADSYAINWRTIDQVYLSMSLKIH